MINLWAQFKTILPGAPLRIGAVSSVDIASGTSRVTLLDGAVLTARGTSVAVGGKAFVRGDLIEGTAPDLPYGEIEL